MVLTFLSRRYHFSVTNCSHLTTLSGQHSTIQFKSPTTALILSILLGGYGVDRFYIDDTGMGVGKLLTCGGLGIWAIIDWFMISNATKEKNYIRLQNYLS